MSTITAQEIRDYLTMFGIETDLTDGELILLFEKYIVELEGLIGIPILPVTKTYKDFHFDKNFVFLPFYPIETITSIKIDNESVTDYLYKLEEGLLEFKSTLNGNLEIVYKYGTGLTREAIALILDMIVLFLKYGFDGQRTSIREGDVSVSYGADAYSFANTLNGRIDNLRNKYATNIRLL